jgi:hypothetical protein
MRSWLLSNTTYGTWPPGDPRGSITSVRDIRPSDLPLRGATPSVADVPGSPGTGDPEESGEPGTSVTGGTPEALASGASRFEHDLPGQPWEPFLPGLYRAAKEQMKGPPIFLDLEKSEIILTQFQETAAHRYWKLLAVAILRDHFHLVVQVHDDPDPKKILADFKAYASRTLNKRFGQPPSETWWTTNGSKTQARR